MRECGSFVEISALDLDTLTLERLTRIEGKAGEPPVVRELTWSGNELFISGGGRNCMSVGRVRAESVVPVPPLDVKGQPQPLDIGSGYERAEDECRDLPMGGFVTREGTSSLIFLASTEAVGMTSMERENSKWFVYSTDNSWKRAERLSNGFVDPRKVAVIGHCALVLSSYPESAGIWMVRLDVYSVSLILRGDFADFAVASSGELIAVLGADYKGSSLKRAETGQVLGDCVQSRVKSLGSSLKERGRVNPFWGVP